MGQVEVRHRGHRCPTITATGRVKFFRVSPFKGLHARVDELYHISCECHKQINLAASQEKTPLFNKKIFDAATRHVFNKGEYNSGMLKDKPVAELIGETNRILAKATDRGMKDNLPPAEMIRKLKEDIFAFSACKTHLELKELSGMLTDENGKIRGWQKFSEMANKTHKIWNQDYLQAEYIFATSSAEMAARWDDVEKDGDRYNLQYRTAKDDRVRDSHAKLHGTTLPVSDPFWDSYYPPNGWRCRCTAVQVRKEKYPEDNSAEKIKIADAATQQIDSKGRDRNAIFRYNPGKQKVIFPPNHPYYKVKESLGKIITAANDFQEKEIYIEESKRQYDSFNEDWNKLHFDSKTGGYYVAHKKHNFNREGGKFEHIVAKELTALGERIQFLPEGFYKKKSPDLMMRGKTWDIKANTTNTSGAIQDHIWNGKKAENVIFYFENGVDLKALAEGYDRAFGRFKKHGILNRFPKVHYMKDGNLIKYK